MKSAKATGIHLLGRPKAAAGEAKPEERLQVAGLQAAGVAHDLNNLLTVILGYCEALRGQEGLTEPARAMIEEINEAGNMARKVTQGMLGMGTGSVTSPEIADLNESVRRIGFLLARVLGEHIVLAEGLGVGLDAIEVEPGQLERILMNLAINARDAMPQGGRLWIETANVRLDDAYCLQHRGVQAGNYVCLSVSDTGSGMDTKTQSRVFDAFFTTKPSGTGLGLTTVAAMVKNNGGHIAVQSSPGNGTAFHVYFPSKQWGTEAPLRKAVTVAGKSGPVLLVEDLPALRALMRRILEGAGYAVLDAATAREALDLAHAVKTSIPLLVTDVSMPGMDGFELAQKLTAMRADTRVLFLSGHAEVTMNRKRPLIDRQAYLQKPFTREQLLSVVSDLMRFSEPTKFLPCSTAAASWPRVQSRS